MITREAIINLHRKHPYMTQACLARATGVTRQRVHQLVCKAGVQTHTHFMDTETTLECDFCHKLFTRKISDLNRAVLRGITQCFCTASCAGKYQATLRNQPRPVQDAILTALKQGEMTPTQLAKATNIKRATISAVLLKLTKKGAVVRIKRGLYTLPS